MGRRAKGEDLANALRNRDSRGLPTAPSLPPPAPKLTKSQVDELMGLSLDDISILDYLSAGKPHPNAKTALQALKLKLEHIIGKPSAAPPAGSAIQINVQVLGGEGAASPQTVTVSLPGEDDHAPPGLPGPSDQNAA